MFPITVLTAAPRFSSWINWACLVKFSLHCSHLRKLSILRLLLSRLVELLSSCCFDDKSHFDNLYIKLFKIVFLLCGHALFHRNLKLTIDMIQP